MYLTYDCEVSLLRRNGRRGRHDSNVKFGVKMNDDKIFDSLLSMEPQLDASIA